jgi:hypothetical protein
MLLAYDLPTLLLLSLAISTSTVCTRFAIANAIVIAIAIVNAIACEQGHYYA